MTSRRQVGIVGADAPRQIVLAAGAVPVRLHGAWHGEVSPDASELLGVSDAVALRLLDELLGGAHDGLDGLVVCNDSAANLRLFYVLRVLAGRGRVRFPVTLLDAPRGLGAPRERFVARQYARLAAFCSSLTGEPVDAHSLASAATRERALGEALARLRARRVGGECTGSAALAAYAAAATRAPEDAVAFIDAARTAPAADAAPIVVTGSSHPDPTVYDAIEATGLVVRAEDHDAGDASWIGEAADGSSLEEVCASLAREHARRPPLAARSRSRERAAALAAVVSRVDARGVLALARDLDDAPAWDLAAQRTAMSDVGLPLEERVRIAPESAARDASEAAIALRARIVKEPA